MRAVAAALLVLVAGCRDEAMGVPPDLSSQALFCPTSPPPAGSYACEPTAIPFCTYPAQGVTCRCVAVAGSDVLVCGAELQPDGGQSTTTGT